MFRAAKLLVVLIHGMRGPSDLQSRCGLPPYSIYTRNPLKSRFNQQFPFGIGSWKGDKTPTTWTWMEVNDDKEHNSWLWTLGQGSPGMVRNAEMDPNTNNQSANRPWRSLIWAKETNVHINIETSRNITCLLRRPPTVRRIAALLRWSEGDGLTQLSEMGRVLREWHIVCDCYHSLISFVFVQRCTSFLHWSVRQDHRAGPKISHLFPNESVSERPCLFWIIRLASDTYPKGPKVS